MESAPPDSLAAAVALLTQRACEADALKQRIDSPTATHVLASVAPQWSARFPGGSQLGATPRRPTMESMGSSTRNDITSAFEAAVEGTAGVLLPQDKENLLHQLGSRPSFQRACGWHTASSGGYDDWARQPSVQAIATSVREFSPYDPRRRERLSLLHAAPQEWIMRVTGVGVKAVHDAIVHAEELGPGAVDVDWTPITRNRRSPDAEAYIRSWLEDDTNTVSNPALDQHGRPVRRRVFLRNKGFPAYQDDAKKAGRDSFCRRVFYDHAAQQGIKDPSKEAGLCNICAKWGRATYDALRDSVGTIYAYTDARWQSTKDEINELENYFVRGGPFCARSRRARPASIGVRRIA